MNRCPACGKLGKMPTGDGPLGAFPFCSDRCKLRDLGKWLTDAYQIPVGPTDEGDDETPPAVWVDPKSRDRQR